MIFEKRGSCRESSVWLLVCFDVLLIFTVGEYVVVRLERFFIKIIMILRRGKIFFFLKRVSIKDGSERREGSVVI